MKLTKLNKGTYTGEYNGHKWTIKNMRLRGCPVPRGWSGFWEAVREDHRDSVGGTSLRETVKLIKDSRHICEVRVRR